jgi:hypothetical protein
MKYYLILLLYFTSCVGVNKEVLEFGLNSKMDLKNGQKQIAPNQALLRKFKSNCQSEFLSNYLNKVFLIQHEYTSFISLVTSKEIVHLDSLILKDSTFVITDFKTIKMNNEIDSSVNFYVFKMEKLKTDKVPFIRIAFKEPGLSNIVLMDVFLENEQSGDSFYTTGAVRLIKNIQNIRVPKRK